MIAKDMQELVRVINRMAAEDRQAFFETDVSWDRRLHIHMPPVVARGLFGVDIDIEEINTELQRLLASPRSVRIIQCEYCIDTPGVEIMLFSEAFNFTDKRNVDWSTFTLKCLEGV